MVPSRSSAAGPAPGAGRWSGLSPSPGSRPRRCLRDCGLPRELGPPCFLTRPVTSHWVCKKREGLCESSRESASSPQGAARLCAGAGKNSAPELGRGGLPLWNVGRRDGACAGAVSGRLVGALRASSSRLFLGPSPARCRSAYVQTPPGCLSCAIRSRGSATWRQDRVAGEPWNWGTRGRRILYQLSHQGLPLRWYFTCPTSSLFRHSQVGASGGRWSVVRPIGPVIMGSLPNLGCCYG
ncbi:uncharacterized protein LOC121818810 [Ovis aries]|uniref:uncharacterized protein LOC121818810 n=1 Tax=Ovis aries TaxID=9940 RepID=UPI001C2E1A47|nr:uncharacterized protein LOC121818810 [Ovis aries]